MNTIITEKSFYNDERGLIKVIPINQYIGDSLVITCEKGAIRANHYHQKFGHFCLLNYGLMIYFERPYGSVDVPTKRLIYPGQWFWTPPMVEHCMQFLEKSEFVCLTQSSRDQKDYELDTIKVEPLHLIK